MSANLRELYIVDTTEYLQDWHVRVTWIAFMTLWVFWGLIWCIRAYYVGDTHVVKAEPDVAAVEADPATATHRKFDVPRFTANSTFAVRIERGYTQVTEALFALLCLLAMNSFARGSTRAVMVLAWFFVAFAVIWYFVELFVENRFIRVTYTVIYYALGLAMAGLAFKQGFL